MHADVVVVGLGAMGAATLYQLALRGVPAIGIDQYDPPHDFGSSHGETRITRQAVGEGGAFAPFVIRAHQIWRELEARTSASLMVPCGCLIIGNTSDKTMHPEKPEFMRLTLDVAETFGIAHEVLDSDAIGRRFPQFINLSPDDVAYYEPGGGFLYPEACVRAQLAEAERLGARLLRNAKVRGVSQRASRARVEFAGGEIDAGHVVCAGGPWNGALLGAPFAGLLKVERQVLFWFAADDPVFSMGNCPVFIRMHGAGNDAFFYGFPIVPGSAGVKLATEQHLTYTDADTVNRDVARAEADQFYARQIAGRLANVTSELIQAKACLYTRTTAPGSNFLMDWHPDMDRVYVISACSGHGFKHSAALGEAVAELLCKGASSLDLSPFRMACSR